MLEKTEIAKKVQEIVTKFLVDFANIWKINIKNNHYHYIEICDGFESVITKGLYNKIFSSTRREKEDDYLFEKLVRKFSFITPKHLDIDETLIDKDYIEVAINSKIILNLELSMINQFKAPKDKGIVLINFCNILTSMITENANKSQTKIAGADEVFPIVVYVILKANVKKLKSNLKYIQLFRHETRMESQEEYYFTTINSALEFIENSNYNKLNIKESEFNSSCDVMDRIELDKMKSPYLVSKRNADENYLLYHLGVKQEDNSCIEMSEFNNSILLNTDSTISKDLLNKSVGILNVNLDKLYKEYFNLSNFNEMSIGKIEKMYNDFRIFLRLIESFKQNYKKTSNNLIDFN